MLNCDSGRRYLLGVGLLLLLSGCAELITPTVKPGVAELRQGDYRLDPDHAMLLFKVAHMRLSTYVGRFNRMEATLDFDPEKPEDSKLEARVYTGSIDLNNEELENELRGADWFAVEDFPVASFRTLSATLIDNERIDYRGELTMLGRAQPVILAVRFHGGAFNMLTGYYTLGFSATAQFLRSAFGMDQMIPLVGDEINLEIYAEFQRQ